MDFEWDKKKAFENIQKHDGITFEESTLAFFDDRAIEEFDDSHSDIEEDRCVLIGLVGNKLLRVA